MFTQFVIAIHARRAFNKFEFVTFQNFGQPQDLMNRHSQLETMAGEESNCKFGPPANNFQLEPSEEYPTMEIRISENRTSLLLWGVLDVGN